jgi:xylulose-5-phosphate/fructose-6-phosphate phosphoketolase
MTWSAVENRKAVWPPFDLCVQNLASRYHVVIQAVRAVAGFNANVAAQAEAIESRYKEKLSDHHAYIREHGEDMPEIANWKWA